MSDETFDVKQFESADAINEAQLREALHRMVDEALDNPERPSVMIVVAPKNQEDPVVEGVTVHGRTTPWGMYTAAHTLLHTLNEMAEGRLGVETTRGPLN